MSPESVHSESSRRSSLAGDEESLPLSRPQGSPDHTVCEAENHADSTNDGQASDVSSKPSLRGYPLRRFLVRTALLTIVPPIITAYFAVINWVYIVPNPENPYGHRNALWVYYSWFLIGVFGLGISQYGLAGIEAAMLQDPFWHARDCMTLLLHSGQSWSGPGGWIKYLRTLMPSKGPSAHPGRLWWLLGLLSLLITLALPLSGLSMELLDGYVQTSDHPLVIGRSPDTFNKKNDIQLQNRGRLRWQAVAPVILPGAGVAYTPQGLDRTKYAYLAELPNSLSVEQDVPSLFLIPQAKYPVRGSAWGLRISYNCSVVQTASQLTILPTKNSRAVGGQVFEYADVGTGPHDGTEVIRVYNTTLDNLFSYVEFGATLNTSYTPEGANPEPDIVEYVMWQARVKTLANDGNHPQYPFNNTITTPIQGLGSPLVQHANGSFTPNATFLAVQPNTFYATHSDALHKFVANGLSAYDPTFVELAPPMGVRCQVLSEPGTATVHPTSLSFSGFQRVSPAPPDPFTDLRQTIVQFRRPLGSGPWEYLQSRSEDTVFAALLESTNTPPPKIYDNNPEYARYFQPAELQRSLMRAYAVDALQLMYDGLDSFDNARVADTLRASHPAKVLGPGTLPPHIAMALFVVWTVGCVVLAVGYGFRRRWAETLDGYSFLRFGADYAEEVQGSAGYFGCSVYQNEDLRGLPGLVGDSRVERDIGHISLVHGRNYVRREKLYD